MSDFPPAMRRARRQVCAAWAALAGALTLVACARPPVARPNVLLLTIDTLRADHLSAWGYVRQTSPVLDQLAAEGVRFDRAQAQWPKTGPSFASLHTATYPKDNEIVREIGKPIPCGYRMLAEELRELGYQTRAVVANGAVGREFFFDQGFEEYVEAWKGAEGEEAIEIATRADHVTDLALDVLERLRPGLPYFLWVHYLDPHFPYRPPGESANRFQNDELHLPEPKIELDYSKPRRVTGAIGKQQILEDRSDLGFYVARYDAEIRFNDQEIGRLLDTLRARGDYDRMLTVFTSDHGESLGDHDYYFDHGMLPFQTCLRVPLAVRFPGTFAPHTDPDPVELLHLAPTILELAGRQLPEGAWAQGRSLVRRLEGRESGKGGVVFSEAGYGTDRKWMKVVTDGRFKLVWATLAQDQRRLAGAGVDRVLYDLATDPRETRNVSAQHPEELERLSRMLWAWWNVPTFPVATEAESCAEPRETSPETIEQLKALGYL